MHGVHTSAGEPSQLIQAHLVCCVSFRRVQVPLQQFTLIFDLVRSRHSNIIGSANSILYNYVTGVKLRRASDIGVPWDAQRSRAGSILQTRTNKTYADNKKQSAYCTGRGVTTLTMRTDLVQVRLEQSSRDTINNSILESQVPSPRHLVLPLAQLVITVLFLFG